MSKYPPISLVITDLDNTLWDWMTFFVLSFEAMLDVACPVLSVSKEALKRQLKEVHQRYHDVEHQFALLEAPAVSQRFPGLSRLERKHQLDRAFQAFDSRQADTLSLYPGVHAALRTLSQKINVVGHTEATVKNAVFRLKTLGVADYLCKLYSIQSLGDEHPDPALETHHDENPPVRYLAQGERKPNVQVVLDICDEFGVNPENTLYVGDSLSRDVGMALNAGAMTAWAKYGTKYDPQLFDRLVEITHWTVDDVARVKAAQEAYGHSQPHVVLEDSFDEIFNHFDFLAH